MSMAAENGQALVPEDSPRAEQVRRKFIRITEQAQRAGAIITHMRVFGRRGGSPHVLNKPGCQPGAIMVRWDVGWLSLRAAGDASDEETFRFLGWLVFAGMPSR
jgi:hypothetical protein